MARAYAKVSIEMWGDKKFQALSPLRPSGQSLWLYLLTGDFRTSIPGLSVRVGLGAIADRLKWSMSEVDRRWQEIEQKQMAEADWISGVIWLPRAIEHNEPESPNVIRGWGKVTLPESALTEKALVELRAYIQTHLKPPYVEAFDQTFRRAFSKGFRDISRQQSPNQEQEQEEEDPPLPPVNGGRKPSTRAERQRAEAKLREFRGSHPPLSMQQFRELEAAGERVPPTLTCMHEPCCAQDDECIRRLVDEERAAERRVS